MRSNTTRREFLKGAGLIGAAAAAVRAADRAGTGAGAKPPAKMPTIRLGKLEVSRLILGSNPFYGFAHGNPQATAKEMRAYYTEKRIMAVLDQAAERGVNAVWTPSYDHWIALWNKYRRGGGKLKVWIGQPDNFGAMKQHITACAKNGAKAVCIQGACIDNAFGQKKFDLVREWLQLIHSFGLPAGIATHKPTTHLIAEEKKLPTDFYHQCVYQPENYGRQCYEQAVATIRKLDKPVVAYKVLAAGRLAPKKAFADLLRRVRPKDGLCVGAFPRDRDELAENAALTRKLSATKTA